MYHAASKLPINSLDTARYTDSTLFGTFGSNKTASGWLKITTSQGCAGTGIATWSATRP